MMKMSFQGIKLVTFDATNTLLKFRIPPWQCYTIVARDHGFKGTEDYVKSRLKQSFQAMSEDHPNFGRSTISWEEWWCQVVKLTFRGNLPVAANIEAIANKLINEFRTSRCWYVADGGHNLLRLLRNQGVSVGVISNFDPRLTEILHNICLYENFEFILTSYECGYSKPDRRIFDNALKTCKKLVKPSESLHIGDDLKMDYEGARAAGWHALLVTKNLISETPADQAHVFKDLEELSSFIEQNKLKL